MNMTPAELVFERYLAPRGHRYRVQYPFFSLHAIADFVLPDFRLVIEIDGKSHNNEKAKKKDQARTLALAGLGWDVVRVTNDEVFADPEAAVTKALSRILAPSYPETAPPPSPAPVPAKRPRRTPRSRPRKAPKIAST